MKNGEIMMWPKLLLLVSSKKLTFGITQTSCFPPLSIVPSENAQKILVILSLKRNFVEEWPNKGWNEDVK